MKKIGIYFLSILMIFAFSSCGNKAGVIHDNRNNSQVKVTPAPVKSQNNENQGNVTGTLPPPESFLNSCRYNIPANKVYYTGRAVVLTYHHISSKPFSSITIKPVRFEDDMKMLKDNYFNVVSFRDMINAMQGKAKLPPNAVVVSFDDGIESFYKYAYSVLKKYNIPAVNFIITSRTEDYHPSTNDYNPLSPAEIREMYKSGLVDIQSHSHNGHQLIVRNEDGKTGGMLAFREYDKKTGTYETVEHYDKRVVDDLKTSADIIQKYVGTRPDTFCFPFGHYNTALVNLAKSVGFKYFVSTGYGYNQEGSMKIIIRRIRSGDSKLTTEKLMQNIINCGQGKPLSK